jgi:APA family basic amino acid/polyamine antiporter
MAKDSTQLVRRISLVSLIFYGIGDILGAGIYGLIGKAAGIMGNGVWLAFLVSALAAIFTGLTYASLGSRYPKAAGTAFVLKKSFGSSFLAYVFGLAVLCSGLVSMGTASRAFSGYLTGLLPQISLEIGILVFMAILLLIVLKGIKESMWANIVCTAIELSGLVFIVIVGISFIGDAPLLDFTSPQNPQPQLHMPLLFSGAILTFYSFMGFEDILNVAEEVENPQVNLPIGIIVAVGVSSVIYMLISIIAVSVIPSAELAQSTQPLVDVVKKAAPWFPSQLFSFISMFAIANTALLNFVMGSRLVYGMSKENLLPKSLGYVFPKTHTPIVAIFVCLIVVLFMAFTGEISTLAKSSSILLLSSFIMMNISLIILKKRKSEEKGKFEIPYIIPIIGCVLSAILVASASFEDAKRAIGVFAVASILYFIVRPKSTSIENMK